MNNIKNINELFDNMNIEQVEELNMTNSDNINTKISNRISKRIKKSVHNRINGVSVNTPVKPARVKKPFNWQLAIPVMSAVALAIGTFAMFHFLAHDDVVTPTKPDGVWEWIVQPTFEYNPLSYCESCDAFICYSDNGNGEKRIIINENTGEMTDKECPVSHSVVRDSIEPMWVYDPQLELMGAYYGATERLISVVKEFDVQPVEKFNKYFPHMVDKLMFVHHVDSTMSELPGFGYPDFNGFTDDTDMTFGNNFITVDFEIMGSDGGRDVSGIGSIAKHNADGQRKSGVINKNSDILAPLMFDSVLMISDKTAFAMVDGKWGIIGFNGYKVETPVATDWQWIVEPTLEFESGFVTYCFGHDVF